MNIKTIKVPAGKIENNNVLAFEIGETPPRFVGRRTAVGPTRRSATTTTVFV